MNPYPHEPLSPEERELARLTARLPPQGEPSPALDARILAAAHAAISPTATRTARPRWPLALGLAASVVLAVGIAWQLRPLHQQADVLTEIPASAAPASQAAPAADAASAVQTLPATAEALPASTEPEPADTMAAAKPMAPARRPEAPPPLGVQRARNTATAKQAVTAQTAPSQQQHDRYQVPVPVPPPPMAAAPAAMETAPAPQAMLAPAPAADQSPPAAALAEADATQATLAKREAGASSARRRMEAAPHKAATAAVADNEATTQRMETSGARPRTDLQVPVSEDSQLPARAWLERIRTRYGLGDAEAARQSLLLFVKEHPRETVPDDLKPLLEE